MKGDKETGRGFHIVRGPAKEQPAAQEDQVLDNGVQENEGDITISTSVPEFTPDPFDVKIVPLASGESVTENDKA